MLLAQMAPFTALVPCLENHGDDTPAVRLVFMALCNLNVIMDCVTHNTQVKMAVSALVKE